jgi:hypothetical protein
MRLSIEESVPNWVNALLKKQGNAELDYFDYLGRTVPGNGHIASNVFRICDGHHSFEPPSVQADSSNTMRPLRHPSGR